MREVLDRRDLVLREVERVEQRLGLQSFDLVDEVLVQIQRPQLFLVLQTFDLPQTVAFEPKHFDPRVLVQVLDRAKALTQRFHQSKSGRTRVSNRAQDDSMRLVGSWQSSTL